MIFVIMVCQYILGAQKAWYMYVLCALWKKYLSERAQLFGKQQHAPLFQLADGSPLTRSLLNNYLKNSVAKLGFNPDQSAPNRTV